MSWFKATYRSIADHLGKLLSVLGGMLLSVDVAGYGSQLSSYAGQYLGANATKKLGIVIFVLLFLRTLYTGYKARQSKPGVLPPPAVDAVRVLMIALVLATTFSTCIAVAAEVPIEKDAPKVEGHPLTSIVVTQCNLIVAVYMTMSDGRLLRFDKSAAVPSSELMTMAYSAVRSERVEVSCSEVGAVGFEKHEPV
ncbi:MAG: hypothetical protein JWO52_4027 [Gammaproteobacteria bacterium]|nr:hypothetical protein [Gammaproteobacteria bacterium]